MTCYKYETTSSRSGRLMISRGFWILLRLTGTIDSRDAIHMVSMPRSHLFGPVFSRRLGHSLGIDLVPLKTCTYDCVYCECGRTTRGTITRQVFYPVQMIISEIEKYLLSEPSLDYITFSGSGEPTLSCSLGSVIRYIKEAFPSYRIAILTNSSLLPDPMVRSELLPADVVLPTLSTVYQDTFGKIHLPEPSMRVSGIIEGIVQFRNEYRGEIWLEVFIIPGINTSYEEVTGMREAIRRIRPDRVQVNTLDRPGTESWVRPASREELVQVLSILEYNAGEIIPSEYW